MGQYYKGVILNEKTVKPDTIKGYFLPRMPKLMEHSYLDDEKMQEVMDYLYTNGPQRVVWAGDYADEEPDGKNLYYKCRDEDVPELKSKTIENPRYIINRTRMKYVDLSNLPPSRFGATIHPLPLLCAEGNGEGGGDYFYPDGQEYVGTWARDLIAVSDEEPVATEVEKSLGLKWKRITPNFTEKE